MRPLLILILFVQTVFVFAQEAKDTEWRTLEEKNYSIQYPFDWIADNSGQLGAELFLFSPENSKGDQFIESINLVIADLPDGNISLEEYAHRSEDELASMITNFKLLENKQLKNQNGDYRKVVYTGDHNKYKLRFIKYYWIVNNKVYVLTFTGEQEGFEGYSSITKKILSSFKIKK